VQRAAHVRPSLLAFPCVAAFFVTGCSKPIDSWPAVTVEHVISPEPPQVGPATVLLKLADPAAKPISGVRIAPVFEEASETEPGQYQAHLKFAMPGDWVILLHVRLPGGQRLERQFNVGSVRPTRIWMACLICSL